MKEFLKFDNEIKKLTSISNRLLLFVLINANLFTNAISAQLPSAIPIPSYGVWDRGDQFIVDPTNSIYDFVRGIRADIIWRELEPFPGVYNWSTFDAMVQIAATHNKLVYTNLLVGPECPAWVYTNGVPKVLTSSTQFNGQFPYYLDQDYIFFYYKIIAQFGQHIRTLPQNLRKKIIFVQVMTGCTGDEVAYKGTVKPEYQSYRISDTDWLNFRIKAFNEFKKAFYDGDVNTRVPMLFNSVTPDEGSYLEAWKWITSNIGSGFGIKGSAYVRGHHLDSHFEFKNLWYDYLVNPQNLSLFSRAEMDQSFTKPLYTINLPLGFYWGMLSGLSTGLSVWDLSAGAIQAAISDPSIMESLDFFNKYSKQIYPSLATGAYCIFHEGLNSADAIKFPSATYGSPINHGNKARYEAICNATKYRSRGAKMDDSFAATQGQVYQRDSQTGYNDAGWQIEEGNYERWITQIDPEGTSIGLFRVRGTINTSSSKYDRFARSFESRTGKNTMFFRLHNEFLANNKTLKFTIRWLDKKAGSTWAFKYRNASGLQTLNFMGIGGNQWKEETITLTDAIMNQGGVLKSDFLLVNTDGIDDIFNGVEMDVIAQRKQNQSINFNALASKTTGDADFNPGATASSGLAVFYISSNTAVATIVNGLIHIVGAGISTITASQVGNTNYNAATNISQKLSITTEKVVTAYAPTSFTVLSGAKVTGTIDRIAANDGNVMVFSSTTSNTRQSDWYSSTFIIKTQSNFSVSKLTINYDGKYSIRRTQLLSLYNWSTSSWIQIDSRTVSTTDQLVTNIQNSPVNFISPKGEIRLRANSSGGNTNYTCSVDWVSITVEYSSG